MTHLAPADQIAQLRTAEHLAEQLASHGYRMTQPRLAVVQAISVFGDSFTVNDIEQWLLEQRRSPGIASIFRTVRLLTDHGLLQRIHGLDDCHRYSLSHGHQHHVICTQCGALSAFDDCELRTLIERLQARTGYQVERHLLELFGRCPRCQAA